MPITTILFNGRITTQDNSRPEVAAIAISNGRVSAIGTNDAVLAMADSSTQRIDLENRRVIPGLNDSHLHVIRAGLFSNLELRWDGVPTIVDAMRQLKEQARRTPTPQWVRVIGGWNEFQFAEGRMPTFKELNDAAPDTPVFLLHLYDSAMLNKAAIRVLGMDKNTPNPPGGMIAKDHRGNPTGLLIAGDGSDLLRVNGAGENLAWSAADFENFLQPRPDLKPVMESELESIVMMLAEAKWPWRIHATYDETIDRFLSIFERVHCEHPIDNLRWFIDHAETVTDRNLERIKKLGGGIAIQHRMAYQGEYFIRRYGVEQVKKHPPIRQILKMGIPVGAGTDGTRVASYHPWTCLWWMVTGKTVGGTVLHDTDDCMTREEALRLYTQGSAWFSNEDGHKGTLSQGNFADLAVLSDDYFSIEPDAIRGIESVLTMVGGKIVYGKGNFNQHAPELPPVSPDWSPVAHYGGYDNSQPSAPSHEHSPVMSADGRVWEKSCGCGL